MSVSLLVITHDEIGQSLVDTATTMLGTKPMHVDVLSVSTDDNPDTLVETAQRLISSNEAGTLVLTDMYGSTPSNIACKLMLNDKVRVVGGINLPMLVRVLNYPRLSLDDLVHKAVSGGMDGVVTCHREGS